jgi:hypothetical protein
MQLDKLKKQWRAQWEAERRNVSIAEVKASIDRKIEEVRRRVDAERAALWQRLSPETRAAWDAFIALRERDLAALAASPAERKAAQVEWDEEADAFTRPPPPRQLPPPRAGGPGGGAGAGESPAGLAQGERAPAAAEDGVDTEG